MIDITSAIEQSKNMENVSTGGSQCFDFGETVLVKYKISLKYVNRQDSRARSCEEVVMEGVNQKIKMGVNTPRHLAIKRVVEGDDDVCYVLQEKSKGHNCASMVKYNQPYDEIIRELEFVNNIPFEHYKKLVSDSCQLYEMGYERKNKNLFYDQESGFWFIDFLRYDKENSFDANDPQKIFKVINYIVPNPRNLVSTLSYETELSSSQKAKKELLEYSIDAKMLLAIKTIIPRFERYEKFYLYSKNDDLKRYLMEKGLVKKDLFSFEEVDYTIFDELYEIAKKSVINKIVNEGEPFWSIEANAIRIESDLFNLNKMWELHKDNFISKDNYENNWYYKQALASFFQEKMLSEIVQELECLEQNENITKFLTDLSAKYTEHYFKK